MACRARFAAACAAAMFSGPAALAQSTGDFYTGKTVKIVIGTAVGGEYGLYAQLIAQHIGRFVPGSPTVIVQSMPGAAGVTAMRYMTNAAPRDGTVLIVPQVSIAQVGLLDPNAQFDPGAFQWIGRLTTQVQAGVVSNRSGIRSLADARTRELIAGGVGTSNPTTLNPRILNALAGTKFKIVSGYKGTAAVMIAWERGEVDVLTTSWDMIFARYGDMLKSGQVIPLYVYALKRPAELPNVPLMTDFGRTETERAFLQIYGIGAEIGRSLAAPPGMPKEHLDIWRVALMKMLGDPEFKAAVRKGNIRLDPLDGVSLAERTKMVMTLPPDTVAKARKFYEGLLAEVR
jgi:tripartite-type tricarboxylate transporter receptor subunit TctC